MGTPGLIAKYCSCIDPTTGNRVGVKCPQLRRGSGGAWSPHHGTWYMQIELPAPAGKPRRQFRRYGYATRTEAQAVLDEVRTLLALAPRDPELTLRIAQLLADLPPRGPLPTTEQVVRTLRANIDGVEVTLGAFLDDWLSNRSKLAPGTMRSYENNIRLHLKPHLGKLALHALRPIHIQDMFTAIADRNQHILDARQSSDPAVRTSVQGRRIISPAMQHRIRATLRKALNDAVRVYKLIEYNPATAVDMPSGARPHAKVRTPKAVEVWQATGRPPSKVMVWPPAMASAFLDHTEGHDIMLYALFSLVAAGDSAAAKPAGCAISTSTCKPT